MEKGLAAPTVKPADMSFGWCLLLRHVLVDACLVVVCRQSGCCGRCCQSFLSFWDDMFGLFVPLFLVLLKKMF